MVEARGGGAGVAPFARLAVVNRGEPAMRLVNAVREWNAEGRPPLRTIALYTAVDRHAMFVREADEAVLIGPETDGGAGAPNPYLDLPELARALRACRAEAVWPGWGFVSENAAFAELCRDLGIVFVGPPPEATRALGDKIGSKLLAARVGVPMAPWSGGAVADLDAARAHGEAIGYPLMVKATAGGGGRGIRLVAAPEELPEAFARASAEGARTTGDGTVFLERAVRGGRHVEVQVVADATGDVWTLGVRDCSVQRRNQKVIEESASVALDAAQEELLRTSAAALVREAGYVNAGTVEFLYEPRARLLSFLEVNTRLQVEHPVTEACTGVDIVKLQLHVAMGGRLADVADAAPEPRGHAIEARLTAEDPEQGFAPAPGVIEHLALPSGPGVRVDTGVAAGDVIPPQFDSMIAKVVAWGRDREEARARLARALRQTAAVVDGGTTNKAFLLDLLDRPQVRSGEVDTGWLDGLMAQGYRPPRRLPVALLAVAVEAQAAHVARQRERLFASAARGRPEVGHESWHQIDVRAGGAAYRLQVAQTRGNRYRVELDGTRVDVTAERTGRFERRLTVGTTTYGVLVAPQGPDYLVEVDGAVHRISGGEAGLVRAPAPAMVVALPVAAGDTVEAGATVAVVESMKLETALRAPFAGRVREVLVAANTQVEGGTTLLRLEPAGGGAPATDGEARVDLAALAAAAAPPPAAAAAGTPAEAAAEALAALRDLVLGYDVDEADARALPRALSAARAALPGDDPDVLAGELSIMQIFADLSALSRNRRGPESPDAAARLDGAPEADSAESAHNPQEYLHAFLRSRDADVEGLPESFRARLRAALRHYGVPGDKVPAGDGAPRREGTTAPRREGMDDDALTTALYRIFLAHRRASAHVPVLLDLLQWRLTHTTGVDTAADPALPPEARERYLRTLEHLITATQVRHPVVGDLARRVRYRLFDEPLMDRARARGQEEVRAELDRLAAAPDAATRAALIDAIVASADPILSVFRERDHAVMLEVMTRRYYRVRPLTDLTVVDRGGRPLLTATYRHGGRDHVVLATTVHTASAAPVAGEPPAVQADLRRIVGKLPTDATVLLDLYVTAGQAPDDDPERSAEKIRDSLGTIPAPLSRVAVAVRRAGGDERSSWFTFRPRGTGPTDGTAAEAVGADGTGAEADRAPVEDRTLRGLHPMVAERLGVWRLRDFTLTRLPSPIDVHLFRAVGRNVPDDRRLVALSDVRDLTAVRDERGRVRALPQLEHVLDACLDALRAARAASQTDPAGTDARSDWNRVLLYVWPVVDLPLEEFDAVVSRLAPRTEGLGLEQILLQFRLAPAL
ncbi:MAG TPA: biotin carboxylase N-terminal domain-containing protein, partial [Pseudonocardia sp.]